VSVIVIVFLYIYTYEFDYLHDHHDTYYLLYFDRPAFKKDGTVTAANSSKLSDGACAFILMSADRAGELGLKPLFKIRGFGDAARDPVEFTIGTCSYIYSSHKYLNKNHI